MWSYLMLGVVYGFAAAMQPGAFQTYLFSQTVRNGWRRTLPIAFAPLLSDGPVIIFILLVLSHLPFGWLPVLCFAGGIFVLFLALGTLRGWQDYDAQYLTATSTGPQHVFQAVFVNLLNPAAYLFWSFVTGPLLIKGWKESPVHGISLLVGFYVTLVLSLVGLVLLFAWSGKMGPQVNRALLGLSGLALAGIGFFQIWVGVTLFLSGAGNPY